MEPLNSWGLGQRVAQNNMENKQCWWISKINNVGGSPNVVSIDMIYVFYDVFFLSSLSLSSHHHLRAIGSKRVKAEIWMCFWGVMCVIVSVIWEENLKPTSSQAPTNWALAITGPHPSPKCPGSWKSTNIQWWQWCDVASWCLLDTCRRSCAMILNLKLHTFQQQNTCEKKIQGTWSRINLGFSPRTNII